MRTILLAAAAVLSAVGLVLAEQSYLGYGAAKMPFPPAPLGPPVGNGWVPAEIKIVGVGAYHNPPGAGWLAADWIAADKRWSMPANSLNHSIQVIGTVTVGTGGGVEVGGEEVAFSWETDAGWYAGCSCVEWDGNNFAFTIWEGNAGDLTPVDDPVGRDFIRVKIALYQNWKVNNVVTPFLTCGSDSKLTY